jgi:hypothetical protein
MVNLEIARRRLHNQHITRREIETPQALVEWLGAVQAQNFAGAKWALGLRLYGATDNDIEQTFNDGAILRTHVMRPTWHFVSAADIRWLLDLTAPRVRQAMAHYNRVLELDEAVFARTNAVLAETLQGGKQLTRDELADALRQAGIATENGQRVGNIVMRAELDGVICSGARRGKQFTYALLAERAPQATVLARDEALTELTVRYFSSHGLVVRFDSGRRENWPRPGGIPFSARDDRRSGVLVFSFHANRATVHPHSLPLTGL